MDATDVIHSLEDSVRRAIYDLHVRADEYKRMGATGPENDLREVARDLSDGLDTLNEARENGTL